MSATNTTTAPLTYSQWLQRQDSEVQGTTELVYIQYLKDWYKLQTKSSVDNASSKKEAYIQLLKELNFLFAQEDADPFLKNIDYNSDEDLIIAIPFFAKKLKEIAAVLNAKREAVKRAKSRYGMVGSKSGIENLIREHILRSFTKKEGYINQVPILPATSFFPELTAIKDNFSIELEELHDKAIYHDSSPNISPAAYTDPHLMLDYLPLESGRNITEADLLEIFTSRYLPRAGETELFNIFKDFVSNGEQSSSQISNLIAANQKYLGETFYGLTAVRVDELNLPDNQLNISLPEGNSWFLWPSGFQVLDVVTYNNTFEQIPINSSNLLKSGATAGSTYEDSDIIFTDKNGSIEAAWLQGTFTTSNTGNVQMTIKAKESMQFLYPYVGFDIASKALTFDSHKLTERDTRLFNLLNKKQQESILTDYYTKSFPLSSIEPVYLNQSTLIESGAAAGEFSDVADVVFRRKHNFTVSDIHSDNKDGQTEIAFAYKFQRTDLPVKIGTNNVHWPIEIFDPLIPLPLTFTEKDCLPVKLAELDPKGCMSGAVAGVSLAESDVIYKLNSKTDIGSAVEAAWLGTQPLSCLNIVGYDTLDVLDSLNPYGYKTFSEDGSVLFNGLTAVDCAHVVTGAIQNSLAFKTNPGTRVSFVWCGKDTYADEVFNFVEHDSSCEYYKTLSHDYYKNQDYLNPLTLSDRNYWKKCSCKSVNYSPIGHVGTKVTDYNTVTDLLYADPYGYGDGFTINGYKDTRGFNSKESPQFSYFLLNPYEKGDKPVGWGPGRWVTGKNDVNPHGDRMILNTGKRYTYYRSALRKDVTTNTTGLQDPEASPFLIVNHPYEAISVIADDDHNYYDIVIAIDSSRSQTFDFEKVRDSVGQICAEVLKYKKDRVQIGLIAFGKNVTVVNYLTNGGYELNLQSYSLKAATEYPDFTTNIVSALEYGKVILTEASSGSNKTLLDLRSLCSNINGTILNESSLSRTINLPRSYAKKKLVIISDGQETPESGEVLAKATVLKNAGIEIIGISMGELSLRNEVMEKISSSSQHYFNLQKFLVSGDGDYNSFVSYIAPRIRGHMPFKPVWRKAVKGPAGNWIGLNEISDMELAPNDYLIYVHQSSVIYTDYYNDSVFTQPSISFAWRTKLDGWDYETSSFSKTNIGPSYGARPYWGVVPTDPVPLSGQVKFVDGYLPIRRPDVSSIILTGQDYMEYNSYGTSDFEWNQPANFAVSHTANVWNELTTSKKFSNLSEFLKPGSPIDAVVEATWTPSNMVLEGFSQYKPAKYHYISRNDFNYSQDLFLRYKCLNSFTTFTSGAVISPLEPYANLDNKFYPTVANMSFPSLAVTEKEVGGYFLPERLGVSTYRGRGYSYNITSNSLSASDIAGNERVFLDPEKYGPRNRGLTKEDQLTPVVLTSLDNQWISEPYGAGDKTGVLTHTRENQKLTPYQSSYETNGFNHLGLARQGDDFQFWKFDENGNASWNDTLDTNYRGQVKENVYQDKIAQLLTNKGSLVQWRTDLFGFDFGLYKHLPKDPVEKTLHSFKSAPVVTHQMTAKHLDVWAYGTLGLSVSGTQPFSYQWYKNGEKVAHNGTGATYTFYKALTGAQGTYHCDVSNMLGKISSGPIIVTVG